MLGSSNQGKEGGETLQVKPSAYNGPSTSNIRRKQHPKRNSSDQMMQSPETTVYAVVICDDHPAFAKGVARLLEEEAG